jgi:hypothetical protein
MASISAATVAYIAVAATAIGAGVSAYGSYQSGKAQQAISNFNAAQKEREAKTQLLSMQTQAALQEEQARANFKLRSMESDAKNSNAKAIEDQALQQDAINRVNLSKRRDEFSRLQGQQRASIAASGAAESSGTPLDLLAETAAKIQQDQEEQHFAGEVQRRTLFSEAAQERLGGKLALAGATLDRNSAIAAAGLRANSGKAEELAAMRGAEIMRISGAAARTAGNYQAGATLISGLGDAGKSYAKIS